MFSKLLVGAQRVADGALSRLRAGGQGELVTHEMSGKHFEQLIRGNMVVYHVASQALLLSATTGGHPTAINPLGSGKLFVPLSLRIGFMSGTTVIGSVLVAETLGVGAGAATGAAILTATPGKKRGYVGNVYLNAANHTSPTWDQVEDAGDIKVSDSWKKFEAPNRASPVIKYLPGMKEWGVEFKMVWDSSNDNQKAIRAAYRGGAPLDMGCADGPSDQSGVSGPNAEWLVDKFDSAMPLKDGMEVTVSMCPHANCSFEPEYLEIS